ncbi:MAG: phosphodiester glycosidase family protein [Verrucomicrobia bacterium]|nr:phosphodiester glycosidase family protein [Verrucomicrobiota bacterium]
MQPLHLRFLVGSCFVLLLALSSATGQNLGAILAREGWTVQQVAPGVELRQRHFTNLFDSAQFITLLAVDLSQTNSRIRFAAAQQFGTNQMVVPDLAEKAGAVAAMNGGFFGKEPTANSGILKIDGKLLPFTRKESDELHFVGGSAVGIDQGGQWHFIERPGASWPDDWKEVEHALAGGHPLVLKGKIHSEVIRTNYKHAREARHVLSKHPRTAIGVTTNRIALLLSADGRHPENAEGLTMQQTAEVMQALGCDNAINLDGGGSTTVWLKGQGIVNHPSDNKKFDKEGARLVRTAVIVE